GLFSGVILQSGTSINPWAIQRRAREFAFSTAALINDTFTNINDSVALLEFLLTVDAEDLKKAGKQFSASEDNPENEFLFHGGHWSPVIEAENEDAFITKKMFGLLQTGNVVTVPLLIGMTSEEILTLYAGVPTDMQIEDQTNRTEMGRLIREIYTGGEPFIDHFGGGVRFYSDNGFTRSIIKHAELYSKVAKTYFYQFSYDGELGGNNIHYDGAEYVGHAEEYFYIFCSDFRCNFTNYPRADQITSERIISILTNFAKHR
ncbi:COesterase domain containing protein, partial [Asbolus verrucosus]